MHSRRRDGRGGRAASPRVRTRVEGAVDRLLRSRVVLVVVAGEVVIVAIGVVTTAVSGGLREGRIWTQLFGLLGVSLALRALLRRSRQGR